MTDTASIEEKRSAWEMIKQYFRDFKVLKDNPKEYWIIQLINFLDSAAYFGMIAIVTLFLSDNIGWDDINAGYIVTAFTMGVTITMFFIGFITDSLGIRKSVTLAMLIQGLSRTAVIVAGFMPNLPGREWIVVIGLLLFAPGMAMGLSVYQSSNRRFSSKRSRAASFLIWYMVMNIGGVAGGWLITLVRQWLEIDITYVFVIGAAASYIASLTSLLFIRNISQVHAEDEDVDEKEQEAAEAQLKMSGLKRFKEMIKYAVFWKFIVLVFGLVGVRAVFIYMYMLSPKYWVRVIGEDVQMGFLQALNPMLIVVLTFLFIPLANKFNVFKMLVIGAIISSVSLLFLVMPYQWFSSDVATAYFWMSVWMLCLLSFGEVIWSPKLQEYTAAVAPQGQEGAYLGMSMVPWFISKFAVSALSGHMLIRWVPEGIGEDIRSGTLDFWDSPEAMWLVLFFWAVSGPAIALLLSRWLTRGVELDPPAVKARKARKAAARAAAAGS